jgi:hypothetical protein
LPKYQHTKPKKEKKEALHTGKDSFDRSGLEELLKRRFFYTIAFGIYNGMLFSAHMLLLRIYIKWKTSIVFPKIASRRFVIPKSFFSPTRHTRLRRSLWAMRINLPLMHKYAAMYILIYSIFNNPERRNCRCEGFV